jgi:hypothetical protein
MSRKLIIVVYLIPYKVLVKAPIFAWVFQKQTTN